MSLIAMAVYDQEGSGRSELTDRTLDCLMKTVDWTRHRLIIVDNGSCEETLAVYAKFANIFNSPSWTLFFNESNVGTAKAINKAWQYRHPGEHCIKMDNDVVIHQEDWIEEMEAAIAKDPLIGQVGLKRKDLWEHPSHEDPERRSQLMMLPQKPGERWIVVEKAKHIMGTCVMHSAALLDKVGYLFQPGLYGFDDVLMSWRSYLAEFYSCFLPHINIDHIDPGGTEYTDWKSKYAGEYSKVVSDIVDEYIAGTRSLYVPAE